MPRITNADQIALILRAKLQKTEQKTVHKTQKSEKVDRKSATERLSEIVSKDSLSDDSPDISKALVRAILEEEFGSEITNDPSFVAIADKVHVYLRSQSETKDLLKAATSDLLGSQT